MMTRTLLRSGARDHRRSPRRNPVRARPDLTGAEAKANGVVEVKGTVPIVVSGARGAQSGS